MTARPADLPDFHRPPVAETLLSIQFERISGLTTAHVGLLWQQKFRQRMPLIEEHPPLPPIIEKFEPPSAAQFAITVEEKPPAPRVCFLDERGIELIQVQADRFTHNWRKMDGIQPYPHFEPIRDRFRHEVEELKEFMATEHLGPVIVNQCELVYVNHIEPSTAWSQHGDLERILTVWRGLSSASFLPQLENAGLRMSFVMPDASGRPIGRLHVEALPGWRRTDNVPILVLSLTARGSPIGPGTEGAFAFLEAGRRWIVEGFADVTTAVMQREWGRIDTDVRGNDGK